MLSIGSLGAGKGHYYTNLAREDYYLEGGEPPGLWRGKGAVSLGLAGIVEKEQLQSVLQGFHPADGRKLVQNAGKDKGDRKRQAGIDLTFSADKSVSVLWAMGDKNTREGIEAAHHRAVGTALDYLQMEAGWTRRGKAGAQFEQCELVFAEFLHSTSRAQDMNLHSHVLVPNIGIREDGMTSALWNNELYQHKMAAGAIYRVALAHELGPRGLGYEIESHGSPRRGRQSQFFRVAGVLQSVCDSFSTRRRQIEHQMQEFGYSSAKAADTANRATREVKGHVARNELEVTWKAQLLGLGLTPDALPRPRERESQIAENDLSALVAEVCQSLAGERATFRPQDVVRRVAEASQADGLTAPGAVLGAVRKHLDSDEVLTVTRGKRHPILTTQAELAAEDKILGLGAKLNGEHGLTVSSPLADLVIANNEQKLDTEERRAAFRYLTTGSGNLKLLAGVAGTGKTSLLGAAREAWEKQGYTVVGMALAGRASRELEHGSGIKTETVRKRQIELEPSIKEQADYHGAQIRSAARWGRYKDYKDRPMERLKLNSKTVVVIDESSMLGLEDMTQMLRLASKAGAKVVLAGDELQLPAIQSVSPFEALGEHVGRFELSEVKRQSTPWMQDAVRAFAHGDAATGLSLLKEHQCLHMGGGGPSETKNSLIADWMEAKGKATPWLVESLLPDVLARRVKGPDKLILAATNSDAQELNHLAREARKNARELGTIPVTLGSGETATRGDRIMLGENNRHLDVSNGDLGTIVKIHSPINANPFDKGGVTIDLDRGKRVRVNLNRYKKTSLGYALTTHKAQGSTVDSVFVYTTVDAARRDMMYVQTSRAREHMAVYCPGHDLGEDLADLERSLEQDWRTQLAVQVGERSERDVALEEAERIRVLEEEREKRARDDFGLERGL